MSSTLSYKDTIQRVGYTIIDDIKVVQHACVIDCNNPQEMRVSMIKINSELYKANRETCRSDFATFEDSAYKLQEELIAKSENK